MVRFHKWVPKTTSAERLLGLCGYNEAEMYNEN